MTGKAWHRCTEIEALKEAGVCDSISKKLIGRYLSGRKVRKGSRAAPVYLYPIVVDRVQKRWKERHKRKRCWFIPQDAARVVHERDLQKIIFSLTSEARVRKIIRLAA